LHGYPSYRVKSVFDEALVSKTVFEKTEALSGSLKPVYERDGNYAGTVVPLRVELGEIQKRQM
jgi:hypothetical protein